MVEVDAAALEQLLHLTVVARTTVDSILAGVAFISVSSNYNLRVWHNFV